MAHTGCAIAPRVAEGDRGAAAREEWPVPPGRDDASGAGPRRSARRGRHDVAGNREDAQVQIHWVSCKGLPEQQREAVEDRIRKLAEGHTDLIDVRLTGRETGHHKQGACELRITADVRGTEIVAARTRDDLGLALDEAMDAFDREIRKLRERRRDRRTERPAAPPEQGLIDAVVPGGDHGFILTDSGERVYFHRNAVKHGLVFEELEEGARVALNLEGGEEGLQATVVFPAPPAGTRG